VRENVSVLGRVTCLALAVGLAACGNAPGRGASGPDPRMVAIYVIAIRYMAETETFYHRIAIDARPCAGVSRAQDPEKDECDPPLGEDEQSAILARLDGDSSFRFVSDPEPVAKAIFERTGAGTGEDALLRFGPIRGDGDRVEVEASAYCGGLCGHWMTLVLERGSGGWEVTGTTGPVSIA
jgi:hypothetical protein